MTPMPKCGICRMTLKFGERVLVGPDEEYAHKQCADDFAEAQFLSHRPTLSRERGDLTDLTEEDYGE